MKRSNVIAISTILMLAVALLVIIFAQVSLLGYTTLDSESAEKAIRTAEVDMQEMIDAGFSIKKINDTIEWANLELERQEEYARKRKSTNYSIIVERVSEISQWKSKAYDVYDQLNLLEEHLNESKERTQGNITEAQELFEEAKQAFVDERYDLAESKIEETYDMIIELESLTSRTEALYRASLRTAKGFLIHYWLFVIVFICIVSVLFYIGRKPMMKEWYKSRIRKLELEKKVLTRLIKEAQHKYFDKGELSEGTYRTKIKKFAELIRDVDRQIPLFKEKIAKLGTTTAKEEKTNKKISLKKVFKKK